jgi:site-specific DNA-adenine methylase
MTLYQGGKKRIGKKIHDVIVMIDEDLNDEILPYLEPFVGMAGVISQFSKENDRYLFACDKNKDLIMMWKAIQRGWKPPLKINKTKYLKLKKSKRHSAERAFVGIVASWAGIWFHAYRLDYAPKGKDYVKEGYNGLMNIKPNIMDVNFNHCSYDDLNPKDMLIYCDPPYQGNKLKSKLFENFDHKNFWKKMRYWSKNNTVIISETSAPKDFKKVWCVRSYSTNKWKHKQYKDCLYMHKTLYDKLNKKTLREIKKII